MAWHFGQQSIIEKQMYDRWQWQSYVKTKMQMAFVGHFGKGCLNDFCFFLHFKTQDFVSRGRISNHNQWYSPF